MREPASRLSIEAKERKSRTYQQVAELFEVVLKPLLLESDQCELEKGRYLLHAEAYGRPHCVACVKQAHGIVEIRDGAYTYKVKSTVVCFAVSDAGSLAAAITKDLATCMELRAGAVSKRPACFVEDAEIEMLSVEGPLAEGGPIIPVYDASSEASDEDTVCNKDVCWLDDEVCVLTDQSLLHDLKTECEETLGRVQQKKR